RRGCPGGFFQAHLARFPLKIQHTRAAMRTRADHESDNSSAKNQYYLINLIELIMVRKSRCRWKGGRVRSTTDPPESEFDANGTDPSHAQRFFRVSKRQRLLRSWPVIERSRRSRNL